MFAPIVYPPSSVIAMKHCKDGSFVSIQIILFMCIICFSQTILININCTHVKFNLINYIFSK